MQKPTVMFLENSFIVRHRLKLIVHVHFGPALTVKSIASKAPDEVWPNTNMYGRIVIGSICENIDALIEKIKKQSKSTRVLIFIMNFLYPEALNFLRAGADSYLTQQARTGQILQVLQHVPSNRRYLYRELLEQMAQETLDISIKKRTDH